MTKKYSYQTASKSSQLSGAKNHVRQMHASYLSCALCIAVRWDPVFKDFVS